MKTEDFERLKAVCEKEGFDLLNVDHEDNEKYYVIAKKKDIWDGVEFVQLIEDSEQFKSGKIFKVLDTHKSTFCRKDTYFKVLDLDKECIWIIKHLFKPSTESAYVEQLKKEALERFGEIKEGDRFELSNGIPNKYVIGYFFKPVWNYCKESDKLSFSGYTLYESGKWATRVKERVKVVKFSNMGDINDNSMRFTFEISGKKIEQFYLYGVSEFLASQLEKCLNGEIE